MSEASKVVRLSLAEAVLRRLWAQDLLTDGELSAVTERVKTKLFSNA